MEFAPEGPKAIPLWIAGRAFLTVSESFFDVINPESGEAIRRVPLCGAEEAATAVAAARAAQPGWTALEFPGRQARLSALADALEGYAAHFARLVREDTGIDEVQAQAEVSSAIAALRGNAEAEPGVVALVADAGQPLAGIARAAAPALRGGAVVVVKPSPRAPSAAFALCELSARAGWPPGVLNLMQGDAAAIEGLCRAASDRLVYVGAADLGASVRALAEECGTPFAAWPA